MRVHVLETGVAIVRERQLAGKEPLRQLQTVLTRTGWTEIPMRAWLIEHPDGLILIDTGQNARVNEPGYLPRESIYFRRGLRTRITPQEEVGPRIRALGFDPEDIRYTVLTHLHLDHDGGLEHVVNSEVITTDIEFRRASGLLGRARGYLPHRWPPGFNPSRITLRDKPYGPFPRSYELARGVTIVGTPGHTPGHISVVLEGEPRLFFAGDASYNEDLLNEGIPDGLATSGSDARLTMDRIRRLAAERETVILPTHDPGAPERLARHSNENRRFAPRVVEQAQGDAVEPDQVSTGKASRGPGDAA